MPFLWAAVACFGIFLFFGLLLLLVLAVILLAMALFFRHPIRDYSPSSSSLYSPADGRVADITEADGITTVGIFLSVFDVHIVKAPSDVTITGQDYQRGKFLHAGSEGAKSKNERLIMTLHSDTYGAFKVTLLAGAIARKIVSAVSNGDNVPQFGELGLIRFGSRVECTIPPQMQVDVSVGDRTYGGLTPLASVKQA
ncbi:MAG: phosphatidylserine decarboxylase [Pseudomonadota bacterium]